MVDFLNDCLWEFETQPRRVCRCGTEAAMVEWARGAEWFCVNGHVTALSHEEILWMSERERRRAKRGQTGAERNKSSNDNHEIH